MKSKVSIFTLTLLLLCMLPVALNIQLVQADVGGTGKFLTIKITGEGLVTATKVQSGETWNFCWADPPITEKVGAGTVELEAFASNGWEFSSWEGDLAGLLKNPTDYKTEKYGNVTAVFVRKTFIIAASVLGNGTVDPIGDVPVEFGASQNFEFLPDAGYHISAIVIDGNFSDSFLQSYTFNDVTANHTIEVHFSANETATVPSGTAIHVFFASGARLSFTETGGGTATGEQVYYPFGGATAWDISVTFVFTDEVNVTLHYNDTGLSLIDEQNLRLLRWDSYEAFRSDVNNDGEVNGQDVSTVANVVKQGEWYERVLDVNDDRVVDEHDVHIVNSNVGAVPEDITDGISTDLNIIWGTTSLFSIFGVRGANY